MRHLFVTFDGGGNQPPAFAVAEELRNRGDDVVFAGYAPQRHRIEMLGFRFVQLVRSGDVDWQAAPPADRIRLLQTAVMANADHLTDSLMPRPRSGRTGLSSTA